jgi:uncharacterized heparinase superfamily protein
MTGPAFPRLPGMILGPALVAAVRRRFMAEWQGSSLHRASLVAPKPEGFAAEPVDLRPRDADNGARILAGSYVFAGSALHPGPRGDPWDRPSPSRRFAVALHRFIWLRDLVAIGPQGAEEGLRLVLDWRRLFGVWNVFAWSPEVLERRVFNLACAARPICEPASDAEAAAIALDLARQARHLLAIVDGPARAAERAAAAAVAGAALAGRAGERLLAQGLARLQRALPETVLPDGGHASRSPQAALELLFDLLTLDQALADLGRAAPDEMMRAIDRLGGAVRFFTLADGALPAFQGGDQLSAAYVAAAHTGEGAADRPIPAARNGYQRLEGRSLQLIVDAAPPAHGVWSVAACAQPAAIEVLANGKRLIVNCGWSPDAVGPPALRVAAAGSTATLGDQTCGSPLRGFAAEHLGPRLAGAYEGVAAHRHESEEGRWLEVSHDGWVARFGLRHRRRLYIDTHADELRGEDRFVPVGLPDGEDHHRRFVPFMVRFHVHPDVQVTVAQDRRSVLLRANPREPGWWLRNDAGEVEIEPSIHFHEGQSRRTSQIVLRGQVRIETGARIRWKLAPAEVWPPPR